ncbi:MAG TPA: hypothetical protein VGM54_15330 [Chthoniobacter sp.]|jgi:hypothetical protein
MPAKKRLILLSAAAALCLGAIGVLAGIHFFATGGKVGGYGLRVYSIAQASSSHPGYLRNTMTSGNDVYVNDYEEAALQLANPEPTKVVALKGNFGYSKVCAIEGQPTTAYVAGDDGSEMPAFAVYRHNGQPPFEWRAATFREMTLYAPTASNSGLKTTDPALLTEVLTLLRDGTSVSLPGISMVNAASMVKLQMASDQLPGLLFCPVLRTGPDGTLYLAESLMLDLTVTPPLFHANWIPASPKLTQWLQSR